MNAWERLHARIRGEAVDRAPNLSILMHFAARYAGVPYRAFCLDSDAMVKANILCHEAFGIDAVTVMSDPMGEAHDYGAQVVYPENGTPYAPRPFWPEDGPDPSPTDIPALEVQDTLRMKNRVAAIRAYADKLKGQCPIIGWVEGPAAEYCDLRGTQAAMYDFAEGADFLPPVLDRLCDQAICFLRAQVRAGADVIGIGDAVCSLLGPGLYRQYGKPYEKRLIDAIRQEGALAKLHICGDISPLLDDINEIRPHIVDVDWMVNWGDACRRLSHCSPNGNFDPVAVMLQGTPEDVARAVDASLEEGNRRSMVSAGCEIPPGTPRENLLAVHRRLAERGGGSPCA